MGIVKRGQPWLQPVGCYGDKVTIWKVGEEMHTSTVLFSSPVSSSATHLFHVPDSYVHLSAHEYALVNTIEVSLDRLCFLFSFQTLTESDNHTIIMDYI